MTDYQLPPEFNKVNYIVIKAMQWLNGAAHIMIGLALAIAVVCSLGCLYKMCGEQQFHII